MEHVLWHKSDLTEPHKVLIQIEVRFVIYRTKQEVPDANPAVIKV